MSSNLANGSDTSAQRTPSPQNTTYTWVACTFTGCAFKAVCLSLCAFLTLAAVTGTEADLHSATNRADMGQRLGEVGRVTLPSVTKVEKDACEGTGSHTLLARDRCQLQNKLETQLWRSSMNYLRETFHSQTLRQFTNTSISTVPFSRPIVLHTNSRHPQEPYEKARNPLTPSTSPSHLTY